MAATWKKLAYEAEVVTKALFGAHSIIAATTDDIPVVLTVDAQRLVGRITDGNIAALTAAQVRTLLNVADGADVTGDQAPQAHKDSHDPAEAGEDPLDCAAAGEIVGVADAAEGSAHSFARSDHTHQIQHSIADNHIVTMDDAGPAADDEIAVFTADGLEGQTPAVVAASMALDDIGAPDASVDFNLQEAGDLVLHTVADATARGNLTPIAIGQMVWQTDELAIYMCTVAT